MWFDHQNAAWMSTCPLNDGTASAHCLAQPMELQSHQMLKCSHLVLSVVLQKQLKKSWSPSPEGDQNNITCKVCWPNIYFQKSHGLTKKDLIDSPCIWVTLQLQCLTYINKNLEQRKQLHLDETCWKLCLTWLAYRPGRKLVIVIPWHHSIPWRCEQHKHRWDWRGFKSELLVWDHCNAILIVMHSCCWSKSQDKISANWQRASVKIAHITKPLMYFMATMLPAAYITRR